MKLPRDLSGQDLAQALRKLGYRITRQTGSHIRLTTQRRASITSPFQITTLCGSARWPGYCSRSAVTTESTGKS